MFLRRIASVAACLSLILFSAPSAAETWHRADTRNFVFYSDGSASKLEEFAVRAEMFDALFREYFGLAAEPPANRLEIYLLEDSEAVSELAQDEGGWTAGFYLSTSDGSFAVSHRERSRGRNGLSAQTVLFHEYVHHLMARYFTFGYPPWYREGFAEFFATATFDNDGDWTLGEPANHRANGLRRRSIPLEQVMFGNLDAMSATDRNAYYGKAWLLVHRTVFDPARRQQLVQYLTRVGRGEDPRLAFSGSFGDLDALDSELNSYLRGRLSVMESQSPIAVAGDIRIQQLGEIESELLPLALQRRVGKTVLETRDALREMALRHPGNIDVLAELAQAEWDLAEHEDEVDYVLVSNAADAVLAIDPAHGGANLLKARVAIEGFDRSADPDGSDQAQILAYVAHAQDAAPADPLPLVTRYRTYVEAGQQPPVDVVNGLGDALRLAPEATDIRVTLAYALANENLFDDALALVEYLASDPHSGGVGRQVRDAIMSLRARRLRQSS